jgi:hypothetical protein
MAEREPSPSAFLATMKQEGFDQWSHTQVAPIAPTHSLRMFKVSLKPLSPARHDCDTEVTTRMID